MLLIDWFEAVDYHGPLVTRYLMMRGEGDRRRRGSERGWEGGAALTSLELTNSLFDFFVSSAIAHLYSA